MCRIQLGFPPRASDRTHVSRRLVYWISVAMLQIRDTCGTSTTVETANIAPPAAKLIICAKDSSPGWGKGHRLWKRPSLVKFPWWASTHKPNDILTRCSELQKFEAFSYSGTSVKKLATHLINDTSSIDHYRNVTVTEATYRRCCIYIYVCYIWGVRM